MSIILRDYQNSLVDRADAEFRRVIRTHSGKVPAIQSVLVVAPTGAGKTIIFSYIASGAARNGNAVTILVHRDFLLEQTSKALTEFGVPHDIIAPGHRSTGQLIQVASVNTLVRRLDSWTVPRLLVIDEAHHTVAGTWLKIADWLPPTTRILGVSATPERLDGRGLGRAVGGIYDVMVEGPQVSWLCQTLNPATGMTYLTQPIVYAPPNMVEICNQLDAVPTNKMGEWLIDDMSELLDTPTITGKAVEQYIKHGQGMPGVAFCFSVDHARHVAQQFAQGGIPASHIDGTMPKHERQTLINSLETGRIKILTSCNLISEGFDLPKIGVAILLRPTKSLSMYLQQVGRALRPFPGKQNSIILDHVGNAARHGLPDDDRVWDLNSERKRKSKREAEINIKLCKKCYQVLRSNASKCQTCGTEVEIQAAPPNQIEEVEGDLVPVISGSKQAEKLARKAKVGQARTFEQLVKVGIEFGFRNPRGWAQHILEWRKEKGIN